MAGTELLKEVAPGVKRAGVIRDAALTSGVGQFAVIQSVAPSIGVEVSPINVSDAGEIERVIAAFVRSPNGGLLSNSTAAPLATSIVSSRVKSRQSCRYRHQLGMNW
jgi:putative ABC transport system substrate-binding protein